MPSTSTTPAAVDGRVLLKGLTRPQLGAWLQSHLDAPPAAAERLWIGLHRRRAAHFSEIDGLTPALRRRLADAAQIDALTLRELRTASDGASKLLFETASGAIIESVLIPGADRATLCLSSQVGCAMGCRFCLTAKMGLMGDLSAAEIVDQLVLARRHFGARPITGVVFMGMGEPLHNLGAVVPATQILIDPAGLDLSARRVTVSTSGIVPAIDRLGAESPAQLAVSLNATTDEVRDWLMPVNRKWPIAALIAALRRFPVRPRQRILIEYVLLAGVNDAPEDVDRLAALLHDLPCKVNLIAFNQHPGSELRRPTDAAVDLFRDRLRAHRLTVAVRRTRGDEAMAACGQLGKPPRAARGLPLALP
jgi:23S rRNA (adenine(2503)-C(2))-methyltransferase